MFLCVCALKRQIQFICLQKKKESNTFFLRHHMRYSSLSGYAIKTCEVPKLVLCSMLRVYWLHVGVCRMRKTCGLE